MRVAIVFGTRPEAIKMAPLVKAFAAHPSVDLKVCVTAQHRDMLDQVLEVFDIKPDIDLNIMRAGQSLFNVTSDVLLGLDKAFDEIKPDWVLVHGDTTTAMAAAMAAFFKRIRIGHVEAGLRTGDLTRPWPEEMNRRVIDVMADLYFAPTEGARQALLREGVKDTTIVVTGNTVVDALLDAAGRIDTNPEMQAKLASQFGFLNADKKLILVTGHRRESFGKGFEDLCNGLVSIAKRGDVQIVYPVHLNQNVREPVERIMSGIEDIHLIEPLEYLSFIYLLGRSRFVITDSGGIQEEAPSLGKPVLVTRDVTERPEAVASGTAKLVGTNSLAIFENASVLLDNEAEYDRMSNVHNPYGDGMASQRILESVIRHD